MTARAIGTGTVSFGLVSIPVKLYSTAENSSSISFNLLHKKCGSRLKQQYICQKDGDIVPRDEMAKGYEFAKDQYVLFSDEEMKALQEENHKAIEITEFVPAAKVDPIFFDGAYYLGPDKGGERAYRLLSEAMRETGRSALAKWIARGKQHLVLVRAIPGGLVMEQLHYADEIRAFTEVPVPDAVVKEPELKLGVQLIEQIAVDGFHPEKYIDEVKGRMQAAIQKKIEGQQVIEAAPEAPKAQIIDLMEALKASLASQGGAAKQAAAEERKPAKRSPRAPEPKSEKAEKGEKRPKLAVVRK